ncbi:MAG: MFS transporter [Chloroflexi bacterium]|nr:MAG: MFS transporter [Chloroflexota bacterium]MBL1194478.1 MFS transporter [Chloroflexota bacterium]NOH11766.1 MFS transporter [Chloroflexota bacterium]
MPDDTPSTEARPLAPQVASFTAIHIIINTMYRMVYPFLPAIARGLGVEITAIAQALTWRNLLGAAGPFLAALSDSRGRRAGMLFGLSLFISGGLVVIVWPTLPGFVIALVFTTLGKFVFAPAMYAYLGDRVPYDQRSRSIAFTEMGWSLSSLLGLPLMGLLIGYFGWWAPFPVLTVLAMGGMGTLILIFPRDPVQVRQSNMLKNFRLVFSSVPAIAGLVIYGSLSGAHEVVNLLFGVWMEDAFGLQITALGAAAAVIGIAELAGEGLVSTLTDRLGKKRAVAIGLILTALSAIVLPMLGFNVAGALAGLFLFYITFEFTFVSMIPMMTEILPAARATLLALSFAIASLGRALASQVAIPLYDIGFWAGAVAALIFILMALAALSLIPEAE